MVEGKNTFHHAQRKINKSHWLRRQHGCARAVLTQIQGSNQSPSSTACSVVESHNLYLFQERIAADRSAKSAHNPMLSLRCWWCWQQQASPSQLQLVCPLSLLTIVLFCPGCRPPSPESGTTAAVQAGCRWVQFWRSRSGCSRS